MTNMPEAALAREAELCYLTVAMVTDYDAWRGEHEAVDAAQVVKVLHANAGKARRLVVEVARRLPATREACVHGCDRALDHAILTAPDRRAGCDRGQARCVAGRAL